MTALDDLARLCPPPAEPPPAPDWTATERTLGTPLPDRRIGLRLSPRGATDPVPGN